MDLFKELIPSLLVNKECLINTEEDEKQYPAYVVNMALANYMDCIFYVNEMNINNHLDNKMQYDYYLNSLRAMKRQFVPWNKKVKLEDLECVKEYFGYSNSKAKEVLRILSDDQLNMIREKTKIGGLKNE